MNKKKILVVSQHFWPEAFRVNDICDFFVEKDCDVEVLCGIPNYPSGKFPEGYGYFKSRHQTHNGAAVRRAFEVPRGNNSNFRIFFNYISFPFASLFHIPRLLTQKYDKIFLFQTSPVMMSVAGLIVGRLKKIETTMYVLDLWPENLYSVMPIKNALLRSIAFRVSRWHYKKADKLIVLSEKMKESVQATTGKPDDRIIVLPQACEKIYESNEHDPALTAKYKKSFNVLFAGSITPAQSFPTMIEAAKILYDSGFKNVHWVIVGDGMARAEVEANVKKAGLTDTFYFEGQKPITDIPKYNDIADVLVGCLVKSNLLEATIPAKVMSYIASGKPIVLAMDGEVQQLINNIIKGGFAGPTEDASTLAKNIQKIYELSPAQRKKMGDVNREYHFAHFERNLILNKLYRFMFDEDSVE